MSVVSRLRVLSSAAALVVLGSVASAQNLPAPAPQPGKEVKVAPRPTPVPKPTPTPQPLLQIPDEPIIIGEPVRRTAPTPAPRPVITPRVKAPVSAIVAGVNVTGLKDAQAIAKLKLALAPRLKDPIRLVIGEYQYTYARYELGASIPYAALLKEARAKGTAPLRFEVDEVALQNELKKLAPQISEDFERTGLNVGGSVPRVQQALENDPPRASARLAFNLVPEKKVEPVDDTTKVAAVKGSKGFGYLLSEFSTHYNAGLRGRTTNLKMAARNINGTVVGADEIFSTNAAIGPRDAAAGWKEAKMFVSGQVVSGTGSGICQAASTLYNAALLADLPVVERHAHSMRVMYVPPSRDAALMWGSKDFKFRNTTGGPVKVETFVKGGKFHVRLWGQKPHSGPAVRVTSRIVSRGGLTRSEAYKIVGDKKIRLSRDSYKPVPPH